MGNVVIDMSMSLDGYIAAPDDNPEQGLGEDGMRLHNWAFDDPSVFERVYGNLIEETGAVIMGRQGIRTAYATGRGRVPRQVRAVEGHPHQPRLRQRAKACPAAASRGGPRHRIDAYVRDTPRIRARR